MPTTKEKTIFDVKVNEAKNAMRRIESGVKRRMKKEGYVVTMSFPTGRGVSIYTNPQGEKTTVAQSFTSEEQEAYYNFSVDYEKALEERRNSKNK